MKHPSETAIRIEDLVEHRDWAVRLARSLVGDRGEPEGLVQEAMIAAWLRPPGDIRDLRAWLGALLRRRAATELRSVGRREEHEAQVECAREGEATGDVILRADMHRRLVAHILALPEPESRALLERYFDGQSPARIARRERCAVSTVHNRLARARRMLRDRLDRDGGYPHWISALGAIPLAKAGRTAASPAEHPVGPASTALSVAFGCPWMLALGSKLTAAIAVAAVALLTLALLRSPADGPMTPPPSGVVDGAPVADLEDTSLSRDRLPQAPAATDLARSGLTTIEGEVAPDDGLFHGRLVERVEGALVPLAGAASLQLASAADVKLQEQEGQRGEIQLTSFTGDEEGELLPLALTGERLAVLEGEWSMQVPEDDLFLLEVEREGEFYRTAESPLIPAGATSYTIEVKPVEKGLLTVTDEAGYPIADGVTVRTGFDLPIGREVRLELSSGGRLSRPEPSRFDLRTAPEPSASTEEVVSDARSPVPIPAADYLRELWVGKDGYQWEKVQWPAGAPSAEVALRRVGSLEIDVLNREVAGGAYQFILRRDRALAASWKRITKDGIYRAEGLGAGTYELSISRRSASFTAAFHRRQVEVVAGETTRVSVDMAAVVSEPTGTLRIEIVPPLDMGDSGLQLMLSYRSIGVDGPSVMGASHLLRNLVEQDGQRVVAYPGVPVGRYAVEVRSLGALTTCEVLEGEKTTARLDLSELAVIEIARKSGREDTMESALQGVDWKRAQGMVELGAPQPFGASRIYPKDGRWILRCVPGEIVLQPTDAEGYPAGAALFLDASPGHQQVELAVDPARTIAARLRVAGVPADRYWALEAELRRALRAALAERGEANQAMIDLHQLDEGLGRQALEGYVALAAPGTLALNLQEEWRERLEGAPLDTIKIEMGQANEIRWSWKEDKLK